MDQIKKLANLQGLQDYLRQENITIYHICEQLRRLRCRCKIECEN